MLLSIAVMPLSFPTFWEHNRNKLIVGIVLSIPVIIYLLINNFSHQLIHTVVFDYIPFIILLSSLFIITGGIHIEGIPASNPFTNTKVLAAAAVLASLLGTTGASMLLIRPLIFSNKARKYKAHTILFFIALAANTGGLLTPLGDPPLFMLYLRGVDFFWFLSLWPEWLFSNGLLLIIYFFVERYYYNKEEHSNENRFKFRKLKIKGKRNLVFIAIVVAGVAFINEGTFPFIKENPNLKFLREAVLLAASVLSLLFTSKTIRKSNNFNWEPIIEVAYLFAGIFITMIPCLMYLEMNAVRFGLTKAFQYYYYTGSLSAFLDNTPSALTFYSLAKGMNLSSLEMAGGIPANILRAISTAAVFFGSMTYIGNGPNFMIKAIAEQHKIEMPHFFGYMYKFTLIILLPIFILTQIIFF